MSDHHHHHHHHHRHHMRPVRLSVPPRATTPTSTSSPSPTTSRAYHPFPYPPTTPTPTPSKHRLSTSSSFSFPSKTSTQRSSLSFLFLLLLSLRSLYSLLPFLRSSSPSFSLFPFSFLVSLLSFLLSLCFSLISSPKSSPFLFKTIQNQPIFSLCSLSPSQHRLLLSKSLVLSVVFLLRFQALRFCSTASMILAEMTGNAAARFLAEAKKHGVSRYGSNYGNRKLCGFTSLFIGLLLLSLSWDRIDCFPFSGGSIVKYGFSVFPRTNCVRIWPMLLPFLSGFLGCYERVSMNWGAVRSLGAKRVRLLSLFYTTVLLFFPAVVSLLMFKGDGGGVSIGSLGWPLANTVVFGVLLSESYSNEQAVGSNDLQRELLVTFGCTIILELFYFPELSLWGLLLCGSLLLFSVRVLDPVYSNYLQLGLDSPETFSACILKPIRHILSERKSRKIALFLLINTGYMVVEFVAGFMSNSLGLISDACHMLFDCAALAIGLYASYISRLPANNQFNYGRGRFEVLSGYVNAVLLVLVGALIVLESFERILDPQEISTNSLLTVSIGGLLVNIVGLIFFHEEHHHAHGGSGSCSHSHPLSHAQSHQQHQHSHDHDGHNKNRECLSPSHDHHKRSLTGLDDQHHSDDHGSCNSCKVGSADCHNDTHNNAHQHHNHLDHAHQHQGRHDHVHQHHSHHELHDPHCDSDHVHNHAHRHEVHSDHSHHHHVHGSSGDTPCHSHHHSDSTSDSSLKVSSYQEKCHHHHIDHNMEGIFLHVLADTMGSVGVVVSTLLIKYKGWLVADPASSIFISVLIISSVIPLLRNSAEVLLQRVPRAHELDLKEAVNDVLQLKGVHGIQNMHVWSFTNTDIIGTLHLHVSAESDKASLKSRVSDIFHEAGIKDLTLQVESVK